MSFLTKFGSFWGYLPVTTGKVIWVAPSATYKIEGNPYDALDSNDGLSPERAVRTVNRAIAIATADEGDVIVLLPGSHSVSATIAVNKSGLTIVGIPGNTPTNASRSAGGAPKNRTRITSTETAGMIFTVTATDTEIAWLHLAPITAGSGISISSAAHRTFVHNCTFDLGSTAQTATMGITMPVGVTAANTGTVVRNCYFLAQGAVGPAIRAAQSANGLRIESSTFELQGIAAWAKAIQTTLVCLGTQIRDCEFVHPTLTTTVITAAIDLTGSTADSSGTVVRCYFGEGMNVVTGTATGDIAISESYIAGSTGSITVTSAL